MSRFHLRATARDQARYDEMLAWMLHVASCSACGDYVIEFRDDEALTIEISTTKSMDWTLPIHGG